MLDKINRLFCSVRLTLALLLGLALISVVGTVKPLEEGRYELFYQSLWFRLLLVLLALNLLACTLRTLRRNLADRQRLGETLAVTDSGLPLDDVSVAAASTRLAQVGYRTFTGSGWVCGVRNVAGRWGSLVVHLSLLLIMAGALSAELGFVGTANLYVGDKTATIYDWQLLAERPVGFEFRLDRFEPVYYPIDLQFAVIDPQTRQPLQTYTVTEGDTVELPGGLQATVRKFYPFEEDILLEIVRNGQSLGIYHALGGKRTAEQNPSIGLELRPVAFRDPVIKQLRSEVSILEGGQVVKQGTIEVNQPLTHRGITIYQTAYSRDKFGFWASGFQFSNEPGKPLVWLGCIALMAGLTLAFLFPYRAVGVVTTAQGCRLAALAGFRGAAGEEALRNLQAELQPQPDAEVSVPRV